MSVILTLSLTTPKNHSPIVIKGLKNFIPNEKFFSLCGLSKINFCPKKTAEFTHTTHIELFKDRDLVYIIFAGYYERHHNCLSL